MNCTANKRVKRERWGEGEKSPSSRLTKVGRLCCCCDGFWYSTIILRGLHKVQLAQLYSYFRARESGYFTLGAAWLSIRQSASFFLRCFPGHMSRRLHLCLSLSLSLSLTRPVWKLTWWLLRTNTGRREGCLNCLRAVKYDKLAIISQDGAKATVVT